MRTVAPAGVAGYGPAIFYLPTAEIPFTPDLITVDNIALTTTVPLASQTFLLRSSIVDDDVLFAFPGASNTYAPRIVIKPNKPITDVRFQVSRQDANGEASLREGAGITGSWFLSVTMNFIQLKQRPQVVA
jgi:hypothetical protein